MKKSIIIPFLSLLLAGCASDSMNGPSNDESANASNFLSISLVASRPVTKADSPYIDGTESENQVNRVRFYFFDAQGNAAPVHRQGSSDSYLSYIDWTPTPSEEVTGGVPGQTVEKILNATLGINMPADNELPAMVMAIINPTDALLGLQGNPDLNTLRTIVADYFTGLTDYNFVITNSVYDDAAGDTIDATHIDPDMYASTEAEAAEKQLIIYVERVLARLDLSIGIPGSIKLNDGTVIYPTSDSSYNVNDDNNGVENENIYVKFLGWNITSTPDASRLVKCINSLWPNDLFSALEPWNSDNYHRSFWAYNPPTNEFGYWYGTFNTPANPDDNNYAPANQYAIPAPNETSTAYMQENAAVCNIQENNGEGPANPSQVIMAAQLVDASGNPVTIAKWANRYYTMKGVLNALANVLDLYKVTSTAGATNYTHITPADLQLVTSRELYGENMPEDVANYYVYAQLTQEAAKATWANGQNSSAATMTPNQVNEYIINRTNYVMAWNSGLTYYYFNIRHLGAEGNPGYFGVVRNHIYDAKVTDLTGLGTPVFKPSEVIIPEIPEDSNAILSVEIRILQWRIVSQQYELYW